MLRTTCLISRGILPVCIAFGDEGISELCALLYRCGRSPSLRLQRNAATARYRTMKPGSFDFPKVLSLGEAKGPRLVCGNPGPKRPSLGWEFGTSVAGLWLSWGSILFLPAVSLAVSTRLLL